MDPLIGGALIQGVGGLLGGLFGRRSEKKAIAAQNAYNDPSAIRKRFEAAGFNPLLGVQQGVGMQAAVGGTNYMGSAIADGLAGLASAWSENAVKKQELQKLQQANEKLQRKVTVQTIRPTVGGMYDRPGGVRIPAIVTDGARRASVPMIPSTGLGIKPSKVGAQMDAISGAEATLDELAIPAGSDSKKAVPTAPIFFDGYWTMPHPDFPDASLTEEYLGDDGLPAATANNYAGWKKFGYGFAQTPMGMQIKGWTDGSYLKAIRKTAQDKYSKSKYGSENAFKDMEIGPNGTLVKKK